MSNNTPHFSPDSCTKSSSSRRLRLTESEREHGRFRRLIANRESAMRAIQRRRAMREDLIKNATELAMETRKLKGEKEKALEEFNYLKRQNECLKAVMANVEKDEADTEDGEAPQKCVLPFYCFFPLKMQCVGQSSPNEECFNLLTTPTSTPNGFIHCCEVSDRQHEGGIGFDLNESCYDGNLSDEKVLKPSPMNCYSESSSFTLGKKSAAKVARMRRKELHILKSIYCSNTDRRDHQRFWMSF